MAFNVLAFNVLAFNVLAFNVLAFNVLAFNTLAFSVLSNLSKTWMVEKVTHSASSRVYKSFFRKKCSDFEREESD